MASTVNTYAPNGVVSLARPPIVKVVLSLVVNVTGGDASGTAVPSRVKVRSAVVKVVGSIASVNVTSTDWTGSVRGVVG